MAAADHLSPSPWRQHRLLWVIAAITLGLSLALAIDLTPWLRGPAGKWEWRWHYQPQGFYPARLSLSVLAIALIGGWYWLARRQAKVTAWLLAALVPLGIGLQLAILAADHLPENGISTVQLRRWNEGDEELAAIGIAAGIGHGDYAGLVEFQVGILIDEFIPWPTHAGAGRVAALGHETFKHAVKGDPIEISLARQEDKAIHRNGGFIGIELDDELAAFGHFDGGSVLLALIYRHGRRGRILLGADQFGYLSCALGRSEERRVGKECR